MDFTYIINERGIQDMGKNKDKKEKKQNIQTTTSDSAQPLPVSQESSKMQKKDWAYILIPIAFSIILTIYTNWHNGTTSLKENINNIKIDLNTVSHDIEVLNNNNNSIDTNIEEIRKKNEELTEAVASLNTQVEDLHELIFDNTSLTFSENTRECFSDLNIKCESVDMPVRMSSAPLSEINVFAFNKYTGQIYEVNDLANEKILLPYLSNNQEIFFYGQYNENNNWDGHCIINAYEDNKLVFITEAEYADGKILSYQQVFTFNNASGKVWGISERKNEGNYNSGITYTYFFDKDCIKDFTLNNVTGSDILTVDDFKNNLTATLEGFYCGNTSNNYYNDETGNAYIVKYSKDGTVRTLYVGNFIDGVFNDHTGNAWDITRDIELDTGYMYYRGNFENGDVLDNTTGYFELNISLERIKEILNDANLDLDLNWYITNSI